MSEKNTLNLIKIDPQRFVARGSFGTEVYEGAYLGKIAAVKVFPSLRYGKKNLISELKSILELKSHVNILQYFGAEKDLKENFLLASELCKCNVYKYLENLSSKRDIVSICRQILEGVCFLHEQNIVHGDLNPSNILITTEEDKLVVKISDFEMSRAMPTRWSVLTNSSSDIGTTEWMPPEILLRIQELEKRRRNSSEIDIETNFATDIFSVGCVLYYVISGGRHPFGEKFRREYNILDARICFQMKDVDNEFWPLLYIIYFTIASSSRRRPSANTVLKFSTFWNINQELEFLSNVLKLTLLSLNFQENIDDLQISMNKYLQFQSNMENISDVEILYAYPVINIEILKSYLLARISQINPKNALKSLNTVKLKCELETFWVEENFNFLCLFIFEAFYEKRHHQLLCEYYDADANQFPENVMEVFEKIMLPFKNVHTSLLMEKSISENTKVNYKRSESLLKDSATDFSIELDEGNQQNSTGNNSESQNQTSDSYAKHGRRKTSSRTSSLTSQDLEQAPDVRQKKKGYSRSKGRRARIKKNNMGQLFSELSKQNINSDVDSIPGSSRTSSNYDGGNHTDHDCALQVISFHRSNDVEERLVLRLDSAVLDRVLENCHGNPICLISVSGEIRSGKSFLLNYIKEHCEILEKDKNINLLSKIKKLSGFKWHHGLKAKTKGIWLWSRAFILENVSVLLMDTQGFNDETTIDETSAILGISLLFSSISILNFSTDNFDETFKYLSVFIKYGKLLRQKGYSAAFQKLTFLIRDWTRLSESQFGEDATLKLIKYQKSFRNFKQSCQDITLFLLPNIGAKSLQKISKGAAKDLDSEFWKHLRCFVKEITSNENLYFKNILENQVTSDELKTLFVSFVDVFNKSNKEFGSTPETIWATIEKAASQTKLKAGLKAYINVFNEIKRECSDGYLQDDVTDTLNIQAKENANVAFRKFSLPKEVEKDLQRRLEELLENEFERLKIENEATRKEKVRQTIQHALKMLQDELHKLFFHMDKATSMLVETEFLEAEVLQKRILHIIDKYKKEFLEEFKVKEKEDMRRLIDSAVAPIVEKCFNKLSAHSTEETSFSKQIPSQSKGASELGLLESKLQQQSDKKTKNRDEGKIEDDRLSKQTRNLSNTLKLEYMSKLKLVPLKDSDLDSYNFEIMTNLLKDFDENSPYDTDSTNHSIFRDILEDECKTAFRSFKLECYKKRFSIQAYLENFIQNSIGNYKENLRSYLTQEFINEQDMEEKHGQLMKIELDSLSRKACTEDFEALKVQVIEEMNAIFQKRKTKHKRIHSYKVQNLEQIIIGYKIEHNDMLNKVRSSLNTVKELKQKHEHIKSDIIDKLTSEYGKGGSAKKIDNQLDILIARCVHEMDQTFTELQKIFEIQNDKKLKTAKMITQQACRFYREELNKHFKNSQELLESDLLKLHKNVCDLTINKYSQQFDQLDIIDLKKALEDTFKNYKDDSKIKIMTEPIIGIDLGTTYSCVAVYEKGKTITIPDSKGNKRIPSYVFLQPKGKELIGEKAKKHKYKYPEATIFQTKRILGRKYTDKNLQKDMKIWPFMVTEGKNGSSVISVYGTVYQPEEISAKILTHLRTTAENYLGKNVAKAVITVPAYFTNVQKQAILKAAEIAGLNVVFILNKAVAVAIAHKYRCSTEKTNDKKDQCILVFDFGRENFDVSVIKSSKGKLEVLAVTGDIRIGGMDIDKNMVDFCVTEFNKTYQIDLFDGMNSPDKIVKDDARRRIRRLYEECEHQKIYLTQQHTANISLENIYEDLDLKKPLTRPKFEEINKHIFDTIRFKVQGVLEDSKLDINNFDNVILVGGSTRIPKIQQTLQEIFDGKPLNQNYNPKEATAHGAVLLAAMMNGAISPKSELFVEIQDITPMSIGLEVDNGNFSIIIPKGTKLPVKVEEACTTKYDNQTDIEITIYEGENVTASNNTHLGVFCLHGIPPNIAGIEQIILELLIDRQGILHLTAKCMSTKKAIVVTIDEQGERKKVTTRFIADKGAMAKETA